MIYQILRHDHDGVLDSLDRLLSLDEGDVRERDRLVEEVRDALIPHARAEEAVFYNSLRLMEDGKKTIRHAYQEHLEAEMLLRTIQLKDQFGFPWKETAWKFRDALARHIEEEEGPIFTMARQVFTDAEAKMMGEAFEQLKEEVQPEGILKTSLELVANVMPSRLARALGGFSLENRVTHL